MKLNNAPKCPKCDALLNGINCIDPNEKGLPIAGDMTVCVCCRSVLTFTKDMQLTLSEPEEIEDNLLAVSQAQRFAKEFRG